MRTRILASILLAVIALSGCRAADRRGSIARPMSQASSGPAEPNAAALIEPTGTITPVDALALALMHNPGLKTFAYSLRAAEARVLQAGLRPNPQLEIELEEFGGSGERSGFDAAETTIQVGQPFELGAKRTKRARVAAVDKELVQWDYESARLDLARDVSKAFTAVMAAQERLALAERLLKLSRQAQSAVAQRVQAGRDSPVDEMRANVALSESRIVRQKAEKALAATRRNLAAMWGSSAPAFAAVSGGWNEIAPPTPVDVSPEAAADNPDVARWEAEHRSRRAALDLEKAKGMPDVTAAGGVRRFEQTDDAAFVVGLVVPLPLFNRNQGGVEEAVANLGRVRRQYEASRIKTLTALAEATTARDAAHEEVAALTNEVLPGAQQAFDAVQRGYLEGKFDYLYVLDTQRTLFETQARYIDAVEAYHKARTDVERLIGGPLNVVDKDLSPTSVEEPLSQERSNEE